MKKFIIALSCLFMLWGCKEDASVPEKIAIFDWVEQGHKLTYNYYSETDTTFSALTLTVITNPGNSNLQLKYDYPQWATVPGSKSVGDNINVYKRMDGIYTSQYESCGFGAGFSPSFQFVRAPLIPILNKYYPDYLCKDKVFNAYKVISLDNEVSVPYGVFKTYILQDTMRLTKEYWNVAEGIIKFELFDNNGNVTGQYNLASRNY